MIFPDSPLNPFIRKCQRLIPIVNNHDPVKVCACFQKPGLYRIAQSVLGGLVDHIEWFQRFHVWERSAVGTGGCKLHGKIGLALSGIPLQNRQFSKR